MTEFNQIARTQISIGGPNRSGKSTLARNLAKALSERGYHSGLIDVDDTRRATFAKDEPILGTFDHTTEEGKRLFDLQKKMQGWTYNNVFDVQIPLVSSAGAIAIFAATHANVIAYERAEAVARRLGNRFLFFLLEPIDFNEMYRRCQADSSSGSDMKGDVAQNAALYENWQGISNRIGENYGPGFNRPLCRIEQATPEEMLQQAMMQIFA